MNAHQVIKFANKVAEICCQYGKTVKINIPKIKVVGSQSAGKSSLIKRIIEYDILPMGDNMVTRTPIHVRLCNTEQSDVTLKLSYLKDKIVMEELVLTFQEGSRDSLSKQNEFKQAICRLTDIITGGKYNVSNTPIFVDIISSKVINFAFVDLPGLVISASTDKGQPRDLRNQIDNLVKEQLLEPNTIAMVVVRSGIDLVTDLGIGLINEIRSQITSESDFHTIGILTKPDLLDAKLRNDLNFIIAGKMTNSDEVISKVESMSEGYFVVNNNIDSIASEEKYFLDNFDSTREIITEKRYCVGYLRQHLQAHLINAIIKMIPEIKSNLQEILKLQKQRAQQLGTEMESEQEKMNYIITTISELSRLVRDVLKDDNSGLLSVGPKIGVVQKTFLSKITNLDPFSNEKMSDAELRTIIDGFNGFHLTSHVSIEQLVDKCIKDPSKKPIMLIKPISEEFVKSVANILIELVNYILSKSPSMTSLNSYPKFKTLLQTTIITNIRKYESDVNKLIEHLLLTEESFVWSTDQDFREVLSMHYLPKSNEEQQKVEKSTFMPTSAVKISSSYISSSASASSSSFDKQSNFQYSYEPIQVRELASKYYMTIIKRMRDFIVKTVVRQLINELSLCISDQLNCLINPMDSGEQQQQQSTTAFIVENNTVANERKTIKENIIKLESAIKATTRCEFAN